MKLEAMVSFMPCAVCFKKKADLESVQSIGGKHLTQSQLRFQCDDAFWLPSWLPNIPSVHRLGSIYKQMLLSSWNGFHIRIRELTFLCELPKLTLATVETTFLEAKLDRDWGDVQVWRLVSGEGIDRMRLICM